MDMTEDEQLETLQDPTSTSIIQDIFLGQYQQTLQCANCGHPSLSTAPFKELSLVPNGDDVYSCLQTLTRPETLSADNQYHCDQYSPELIIRVNGVDVTQHPLRRPRRR